MVQLSQTIRLKQAQTLAVFERNTYAPATYTVPLLIEGGALFSSVWVQNMSVGASLTVRYFETTTGNIGEERVDIATHVVITPSLVTIPYGFTDRLTVTPFHNKVVAEIILTGGSAYFGVYVTVVAQATGNETFAGVKFSSDYDAITAEYPNQTTEIYKARTGGASGTVNETITVVYTDSSKEFLLSAVRS